ncbi:MAG TPA: hypothetical protein VHK90_17225, partial [Thermoanaerobaculia bacterium]|nr:hypothetical protein [Thermoanaerobaculia bacterium]
MRKNPLLAVTMVSVFAATSVFAAGNFRGHAPKISRSDAGLTAPSNAAAADVVRGYVKNDRSLKVARENNGQNGVRHVTMEQTIDGKSVYGAYVKAAVSSDGRLTSVIDNTVDRGPVTRTSLSSGDALSAALAHRFGGNVPALYREPVVTPVIVPTSTG